MKITIQDASTGREITGNLVKRYTSGLTIDDERGVRYYAATARVLTPLLSASTVNQPSDNTPLW